MSQQINLYDPALLPKRELLTAQRLALAAGLLLVVLGVWGGWLRAELAAAQSEADRAGLELKQLQDESAALARDIGGRKPDPRLEQEFAGARMLLEFRGEVLKMLQKGLGPESVSFSEYLRGLSRQSTNGLWLTAISVADDGATMEIQGRVLDPALLPEYIRRLNGEKAFQGRAFAALRMTAAAPAAGAAAPAEPLSVRTGVAPLFHEFVLAPAAKAEGAVSLVSNSGSRP